MRARADAGAAPAAGEPAAGVEPRIADWLLGQQPEADAERTRDAVARPRGARVGGRARPSGSASPAARAGAAAATDEPSAPCEDRSATSRPRPGPAPCATTTSCRRPVRAAPSTAAGSSRLGGAILIGIVALLVAGTLLWIFVLRDDDKRAGLDTDGRPPRPRRRRSRATTSRSRASATRRRRA